MDESLIRPYFVKERKAFLL